MLENFFVSELHRRYHYSGDLLTQLGYLWDHRGEIDLVAHREGRIQGAWEVKISETSGSNKSTRDGLAGVPLNVLNLNAVAQHLAT